MLIWNESVEYGGVWWDELKRDEMRRSEVGCLAD